MVIECNWIEHFGFITYRALDTHTIGYNYIKNTHKMVIKIQIQIRDSSIMKISERWQSILKRIH